MSQELQRLADSQKEHTQELCKVVKYKKKSRHPKTLLKVYRMFLMGLPDEEIIKAGFADVDLQKCRQFHSKMLVGKAFYRTSSAIGVEKNVAKRMLVMFEKWQAGKSVSDDQYSWRKQHPRISQCFTMLINGASDVELKEKCTEYEIEKAKEFMMFVDCDMLTSTISQKSKIFRSTVKSMLKIYREKQAAASLLSYDLQRKDIAESSR
jgi:hypothetical protein